MIDHKDSYWKLRPAFSHDPALKVIYLQWPDVPAGVIVKVKTGIAFSQQAGGYSCASPLQEGVLMPLTLPVEMVAKLDEIFVSQYGGWCDNGINERTADQLDAIFQASHFPLMVDRTQLAVCKEAWIHVVLTTVDENRDESFHPLVEFSGAAGVFIFENSD